MKTSKKDKPEQNQEVPDALGKDELQDKDKDLRKSSIPTRHDIHYGDGEITREEDPGNAEKEPDTPPFNTKLTDTDHTAEQ